MTVKLRRKVAEGAPVVCPVCRRKRLMDVSGQPSGDFQVSLKCPACGLVTLNAEYLRGFSKRLAGNDQV
jgi:hypothetical protein